MNDEYTVVVVAHKEAQGVFDMNMRLWRSHNARLLVVSPIGSEVATSERAVHAGTAGWTRKTHGVTWSEVLRIAATCETRLCAIFEYDSVCTTVTLPVYQSGLFGNVQVAIRHPNGHVHLAMRYVNAPWVLDLESASLMHAKLMQYPDIMNHEMPNDRLFSALAMLCGIPVLAHNPRGYAPGGGTITDAHKQEVADAKTRGATMWHGLKSKEALEMVL